MHPWAGISHTAIFRLGEIMKGIGFPLISVRGYKTNKEKERCYLNLSFEKPVYVRRIIRFGMKSGIEV